MNTFDDRSLARHRHRRWALGGVVLAVFIGLYVAALSWFSERIGEDVERNLRTAPVLDDTQHRGD